MCGIIGIISKESFDLDIATEMRDVLIHRGPDDEGIYYNKDKTIILGHRRLSIIDLSPQGRQPMSNEDGTIWITYNGEIYNFQEIRSILEEKGHKFKSNSDTEVIIHGYEEFGTKILDYLIGMFSFGIWDENEKRLFLARDRVGIKPLYYYWDNQLMIFASEIKAIIKNNNIKREVNKEALKYYFKYSYIPAPFSIWKNIFKLLPGHFLILENQKLTIEQYWSLISKEETEDENSILKKVYDLVKKSVEYRFISDVPVGILLSGGIDSSTITALGSKIHKDITTISIGFDLEKYSELKYARIVANQFKTKSIEKNLNSDNIKEILEKVLYYYDEPLGASSIFPTYLLMETTSKHVKVVISGDGGDEAFGGYNWFSDYLKLNKTIFPRFMAKILYQTSRLLLKLVNLRILRRIERKMKFISSNDFNRYRLLTTPRFETEEIKSLLVSENNKEFQDELFFKKYMKNGLKNIKTLQNFDLHTYLVDSILVKVDRASMANSLEVRVPLLDHHLLEYCFSIDTGIIYKDKIKKYLLKKIMSSLLPNEIINRKKKGFSAPIQKLGIVEENVEILEDPFCVKDGIINHEYLKKFLKRKDRDGSKLWLLLYFELWYRKWRSNN